MSYVVFYDRLCPICVRARRRIGTLDWFGRVTFQDLHDRPKCEAALPGVSYPEMMQRMYVKSRRGHAGGYRALRVLARVLPPLWPIWPLMWLPGFSWLGAKWYERIARNRYRGLRCETEVCSLHAKLAAGEPVDEKLIRKVVSKQEPS